MRQSVLIGAIVRKEVAREYLKVFAHIFAFPFALLLFFPFKNSYGEDIKEMVCFGKKIPNLHSGLTYCRAQRVAEEKNSWPQTRKADAKGRLPCFFIPQTPVG
jgi:hypothetical protein